MSALQDDSLIRAAFAAARSLEPTEAEIAHVLSRASTPARHGRPSAPRRRAAWPAWRRLVLAGIAVLVLLTGAGYAVAPPVRAAIDDVTGSFRGWLGGEPSAAPGRALGSGDQAPDFFRDPRYTTDPRVIAEADGYKLLAAREPGGSGVEFDLGNTGVGVGETSADVFRDHVLVVLGPGAAQHADEHGHVPLFGITARSVKRVELTYESGPPLHVDAVNGAFVLLAEPDRSPRAVVARDAAGHEIGRQLVDDSHHDGPGIDWALYGPPSPRVPAKCRSGAAGRNPPKGCPGG